MKCNLQSDEDRLLVFETSIGWVGVLHRDKVLLQTRIGFKDMLQAVTAFKDCDRGPASPNAWERKLITRIKQSLSQKTATPKKPMSNMESFADVAIEEQHLTDFQRKVVNAVRGLGFGETATYGEIADKVGHPRAARAVGNVMKSNRYPIVVPCHRVLSSSGIGGFNAPTGVSTKRAMLEIEGHQFGEE